MKNPGLAEIQQALTSRVNEMRCLQRLIDSKSFAEAYNTATEEDRRIVHRYITEHNRDAVEQWIAIQERGKLQIEELPVRELRKLAGSLRIQDYNYLPRASLLSEIKKAKVRHNDTGRSHEQDRTVVERDAGDHAGSGSAGEPVREDPGDRSGDYHTGGNVRSLAVHASSPG